MNILTGRIILGDLGAYSLAAMSVFSAFNLFNQGLVSLFFLASIFSYPCLELLRVIADRLISGRSPFVADNDHLHNQLNFFFQRLIPGSTLSNSLTGLVLALFSALPACAIFSSGYATSFEINLSVFFGQITVFSVAAIWLKSESQKRTLVAILVPCLVAAR